MGDQGTDGEGSLNQSGADVLDIGRQARDELPHHRGHVVGDELAGIRRRDGHLGHRRNQGAEIVRIGDRGETGDGRPDEGEVGTRRRGQLGWRHRGDACHEGIDDDVLTHRAGVGGQSGDQILENRERIARSCRAGSDRVEEGLVEHSDGLGVAGRQLHRRNRDVGAWRHDRVGDHHAGGHQ